MITVVSCISYFMPHIHKCYIPGPNDGVIAGIVSSVLAVVLVLLLISVCIGIKCYKKRKE